MIEGIFLALTALAGQTAPAPAADPLAPARTGQIECYSPDVSSKTCFAIARITPNADGSYTSDFTMMIQPQAGLTFETVTTARIENGQVCRIVHLSDVDSAKLAANGTPLPDDQAAGIKAQIKTAITPMDGKKACTTYTVAGDMIAVNGTVDGVAHPEMSQKLIWVKPDDGYKLGQ
jgi:hypothetical protein